MSYEEENSYKPSSIRELVAFWKYLYNNGRLFRVLFFIALFLILLLILTLLIQDTMDQVLGPYTFPVFVFPLIVLVMFILYAPTLPGLYKVQFHGKFRPDISPDALHGLLLEMVAKSIETIVVIFGLTCAFCIVLFEAGKLFSLPDGITLTLLGITAIDTFLITLLFSTLGRYNRDFLRRTFSAGEYERYTSPGNYRNLAIGLIAINLLAAALLFYGLLFY